MRTLGVFLAVMIASLSYGQSNQYTSLINSPEEVERTVQNYEKASTEQFLATIHSLKLFWYGDGKSTDLPLIIEEDGSFTDTSLGEAITLKFAKAISPTHAYYDVLLPVALGSYFIFGQKVTNTNFVAIKMLSYLQQDRDEYQLVFAELLDAKPPTQMPKNEKQRAKMIQEIFREANFSLEKGTVMASTALPSTPDTVMDEDSEYPIEEYPAVDPMQEMATNKTFAESSTTWEQKPQELDNPIAPLSSKEVERILQDYEKASTEQFLAKVKELELFWYVDGKATGTAVEFQQDGSFIDETGSEKIKFTFENAISPTQAYYSVSISTGQGSKNKKMPMKVLFYIRQVEDQYEFAMAKPIETYQPKARSTSDKN
ncbi:MAG: hypothetical protein ACRCY4_02035 [Brevinema sp.]